ncbi:MAG TPA: sugar ABC transporter permease [Anaerolineae bacterium]
MSSLTRPFSPIFAAWARLSPHARREARTGLAFLTPWLVGLLLLKLLPILASLFLSFTNFSMIRPQETQFVGLANYLQVLTDDVAGVALFSTASFALVSVPIQLIVALAFATLMNSRRLAGKTLLRTLFFMPSIVPGTAILALVLGFLDPNTGWLNRVILEPLGLPPSPGPFTAAGFEFFQILITLWSIGPGFLIMLGAMQGIPSEVHEAARVDGAGPLMRLLKITVPMISPAIFFSLVINLISIFGGAVLLDRGNPFTGSLSAYDNYINQIMFNDNRLGYAASLAWVFFGLMLIVTLFLFRASRRWVYYAEDEE